MLKCEKVLDCKGIEATPTYYFSTNVCTLLLCAHTLPSTSTVQYKLVHARVATNLCKTELSQGLLAMQLFAIMTL